MKTINLAKIIETHKLDAGEIAKQLFPGILYPKLALNRVLKGEAELNASQISKLSAVTEIPIEDLFSKNGWKTKLNNDAPANEHVFENGEYIAIFNSDTFKAKLYFKNSLLHDEIIISKSIALSEFFEMLENIIEQKSIEQK